MKPTSAHRTAIDAAFDALRLACDSDSRLLAALDDAERLERRANKGLETNGFISRGNIIRAVDKDAQARALDLWRMRDGLRLAAMIGARLAEQAAANAVHHQYFHSFLALVPAAMAAKEEHQSKEMRAISERIAANNASH